MPEIWLPYGSVEVAVDLKAENLAQEITAKHAVMSEDSIKDIIEKINTKGRTHLFIPKPSKASKHVSNRLIKLLTTRGMQSDNITISTGRGRVAELKRALEDKHIAISEIEESTDSLGKVDDSEIRMPKSLTVADSQIVVTEVGLDPLFGFTGGPVSILRCLGGNLMTEAFRRRANDNPSPGLASESSFFADKVADILKNAVSIEVMAFGEGISGIYIDSLVEAHKAASKSLYDACRFSVSEDIRAIIVSAGGSERDATLTDGLKAVWNVAGSLRDKGVIALIAECSGGLGSDALRMYVSGRLDLESIYLREDYLEGLEDLVYLKNSLHRSTPIIVSALPNYYTEMKMGFHACRKVDDAVSYILSTLGSKTKVHVLPQGSTIFLSKAKT